MMSDSGIETPATWETAVRKVLDSAKEKGWITDDLTSPEVTWDPVRKAIVGRVAIPPLVAQRLLASGEWRIVDGELVPVELKSVGQVKEREREDAGE